VTSWKYRRKALTEIPEGFEAFVYLIEFEDGLKYVGKKNFYSIRRTKVKGRVRRKVVTTESNWKVYTSSSKEVKEKIKKGTKITKRQILHLCKTKGEATYLEVYEQFIRKVLCPDRGYLNKNILGRFFTGFLCD
jgi:hypothetical protein